MNGYVKYGVLAWGLFLPGGLAFAQQPADESLPTPRSLNPAMVPAVVPMPPFLEPGPIPGPLYMYGPEPYFRRSHYEIWQQVGLDRQGFFKPLVVASPYGAYYRYDGKPFPWVATHPLEWMPRVVDTASFRAPDPAPPVLIHPAR